MHVRTHVRVAIGERYASPLSGVEPNLAEGVAQPLHSVTNQSLIPLLDKSEQLKFNYVTHCSTMLFVETRIHVCYSTELISERAYIKSPIFRVPLHLSIQHLTK